MVTGHDIKTHKVPDTSVPVFIAEDRLTGKLVWKDASPGAAVLVGQWPNLVGLEADGKIQVVSLAGDEGVYAFNPEDGKKPWKFACNPTAVVFKPGGRGDISYIMEPSVFHKGLLFPGVATIQTMVQVLGICGALILQNPVLKIRMMLGI